VYKYRNILKLVGGKHLYSVCIPHKYANIPNDLHMFYIGLSH